MRTAKQVARRKRTLTPLKRQRLMAGLIVADVAAEIGVDNSYISLLENGLRAPSLEIANKLAKFYGVGIAEILP